MLLVLLLSPTEQLETVWQTQESGTPFPCPGQGASLVAERPTPTPCPPSVCPSSGQRKP